jgi:hypothetical protein
MKQIVRAQLQRLRRAAVAAFAIGTVAAGTVHASPSSTVVVVPPTDLPALARQTGEGMRLHETCDGRILLYEDAVLDLPGARDPRLLSVQELTSPSPTMDAPPAQDFGAIDTVLSYELSRMFDVKQVRAQMTRSDTGTAFMLTENGLYVVRRPAVEWIHQLMVIPSN